MKLGKEMDLGKRKVLIQIRFKIQNFFSRILSHCEIKQKSTSLLLLPSIVVSMVNKNLDELNAMHSSKSIKRNSS